MRTIINPVTKTALPKASGKLLFLPMEDKVAIAKAVVAKHPLPPVRYNLSLPLGSLVITFVGEPVAKERPRMARGRTYTPPKTVEFEKAISNLGIAAMANAGLAPLTMPIVAHVSIRFAVPSSWGQAQKALASFLSPSEKDCDNIQKSVFDGLNGVLYADDKQIVQVFATKKYVVGPEVPGVTAAFTPVGLSPSDMKSVLALIALEKKKLK